MRDFEMSVWDSIKDTRFNENRRFITITELFDVIKSNEYKVIIDRIRAEPDADKRKVLKEMLPAVTISGIFNERKNQGLLRHSKFICMDFDKLGNQKQSYKDKLKEDKFVYGFFTSASGNGLAVVVKIDPLRHQETFDALSKYFYNQYGLVADIGCKDVARLRFFSYDPDAHTYYQAQTYDKFPKADKQPKKHYVSVPATNSDIGKIVNQAMQRGCDITDGSYGEWMRLAASLVTLGEPGRPYFHILSQYNPKYNHSQCDRMFSNIQKGGNGSITIGTFFYFARRAGLNCNTEKNVNISKICKEVKARKDGTAETAVKKLQEKNIICTDEDEVSKNEDIELVKKVYETIESDTGNNFAEVKNYVIDNYSILFNEITDENEYEDGKVFAGDDYSRIYLEVKEQYDKVKKSDVIDIIRTNTPRYNPLLKFIEENRNLISEGKTQGLLKELALTITSDTAMREDCFDGDYEEYFISKWYVGMIASVYGNVSPLLLALTGKQATGKALPMSALVYTPAGETTIGKLKLNDFVMGEDGLPHKVIGIYDQGLRDIYKLTFMDNSIARCDIEHLWKYLPPKNHNKGKTRKDSLTGKIYPCHGFGKWEIGTLRDIIKIGGMVPHRSRRIQIPLCRPVQFSKKELPLHPYLLGVLLGDGYLGEKTIEISCHPKDYETIERVSNHLPEGYTIKKNSGKNFSYSIYGKKKNRKISWHTRRGKHEGCICVGKKLIYLGSYTRKELALKDYNDAIEKYGRYHNKHTNANILFDAIHKIGLTGARSATKFIPDIYKFTSVEDRIELLRGLMDTDGSVNYTEGGESFSTISEKLALDMQWLVQSLGGKATISKNDRRGQGRNIEYCVFVYLRNINPFYLKRKASRHRYTRRVTLNRSLRRIEPDGREMARCILLDYPEHTFVTDNFIVTHNTWWFRYLLPEGIRKYYAEIKLSTDKDAYAAMTKNLLIMDDELTGKTKMEEQHLKEITSKAVFTYRPPYGITHIHRKRLAVLAGTTNDEKVLSDPTGNRRIIPINVLEINHSNYNAIDKTALFMEAVRLYESKFEWELSLDDIKRLNENTVQHLSENFERELISIFFDRPESDTEKSFAKFMTTTDIILLLEKETTQKLSVRKIGMELRMLAYERIMKKIDGAPRYGYLVRPKNLSTF